MAVGKLYSLTSLSDLWHCPKQSKPRLMLCSKLVMSLHFSSMSFLICFNKLNSANNFRTDT